MKRKLLIIFAIFCFFALINKVNAKSSISCSKTVTVGDVFECKVLIDTNAVMVKTDDNIKISNISGENYLKLDDKQVIFYKSGIVKFGPAESKYTNYIISLYSDDGIDKYDSDQTINVIAKTTTTTTTKKKSSNNYLSSITIDGNDLQDFSKNKTKYYVTVENNVNTVLIKAVAEDDTSEVYISGPDNLEVGDNEYTIGVTSEDNTTKFYKIIITKKEAQKSSDTKLKNIKIKGYNLNFDKKAKTFYLNINNEETSLNISVITNNKMAGYEVIGNENLKDGSVIKIKVTAEDSSEDLYRIIIQKDKEKSIPIILIIILFIIIFIAIIFLIFKKRKNKNEKKENNKNDNYTTKRINNLKNIDKKISIDNDEEEKTSFIDYNEQNILSDTIANNLDDFENNRLDENTTSIFTFDDINKE